MFQNISNMNQFVNNKKMNMLWDLKKGGMTLPSLSPMMIGPSKEQNMASITNKLTSGKRLTPEEMAYLREHAPEMYRQAVEADAERKAYESAAKNCKSKEDVQNLHAKIMTGAMAAAKSDPVGAQIKVAAITDSHISFMQSSTYSKLPTEAELNQKQDTDETDGHRKKDTVNTKKERQDLMQEMTDAEKNIQFTLRNYSAQAEKQANAEASYKSEPVAIQTAEEEAAALNRVQSNAESSKAYLQSKGITIDSPMANNVSFSSLVNNSQSSTQDTPATSIGSTKDTPAAPIGSAVVGRAHAAYVTARSTVVSTAEPASDKVKSGLRAKA